MFQTFHKDKPYPIPAGTLTDNAFEYDKVTFCTKIWTDPIKTVKELAGVSGQLNTLGSKQGFVVGFRGGNKRIIGLNSMP